MYLSEGAAGPAADDRRFALKRATDDAHARVEGIVQSAAMFGSREAYLRYLQATWEMRARYERLLDGQGAERLWPAWPGRLIADLIAQDIVDLGGTAPAPSVLTENCSTAMSDAELLGILYVLEGSSLGARVLVKLAVEMDLSPAFGARHLFAQAGDRDAWRSFLALLQSAPEPPCHSAARATFNAFADAYSRHAGEAAG